jgi:outer membrane protein OmpA-like peptidoglycan-associated protein
VGGTASSGKAPLMITFRTGSAELTPESIAVMGKVASALQSDRLAGFAFKVEGHADPRGGDELNQRLSQARAESVVKHLVDAHGILPERLSAVGRGSSELYDAKRPEAPENRRVTIVTQRN